MAEQHPELALVNALWKVKCRLWDGTELEAYTSDESFANTICKGNFGWPVSKEEGWVYKYSKSFGETEETKGLMQWVGPNSPTAASWSISQGDGSEEKWKGCPVRNGLYLAIKLRAHCAPCNKTEPLDTETPLPKEVAEDLLKALGLGNGGLPPYIRV